VRGSDLIHADDAQVPLKRAPINDEPSQLAGDKTQSSVGGTESTSATTCKLALPGLRVDFLNNVKHTQETSNGADNKENARHSVGAKVIVEKKMHDTNTQTPVPDSDEVSKMSKIVEMVNHE
jgi:hypothetical protein